MTGSASTACATYRIQCRGAQNFATVGALAEYLAALGMSHVYLSPLFRARSGSAHGYDIVDPGQLDPALGDEAGFGRMAEALRACGLKLLLDIVPNHVCVLGTDNPWWNDVLENGPSSHYARYFDVDWQPPKPDLANKVLLPVLGEPYGRALAEGRLRVAREGGALLLDCSGLRLPLAPKSWSAILEPALQLLRARLPAEHAVVEELASVLTALAHLPGRTETAAERVEERLREKGVVRRRLETLMADAPELREAVDAVVLGLNEGDPRDTRRMEHLEGLLDQQGYRLSHWRVAADEINYRRFFDVNELAAIRVEEPEVYDAVHALPLRLAEAGLVDGLRIDHVDGLYDPAGYLERLRPGPSVFVEKILAEGEALPSDWPVSGTTGYEFLNALNGLFVAPESRTPFLELYERFTGARRDLRDVAYEARKLVMQVALSSEITALSRRLDRLSEQHRDSRDFTLRGIEDALCEVIACFPVYRTYVRPGDDAPSAADAHYVEIAVAEARRRNPAQSGSIFDFVASVLLLRDPEELLPAQHAERRDFVLRFQQLTGPVMAKGLEDTAAYRFFPLASLAEVGAGTAAWATSKADFNSFATQRQRLWPGSLSATSTHDTKRDEDVRARLNVLSEIPMEWEQAIVRFRLLLTGRRVPAPGVMPDGNDEYLLYQTLVATWPAELRLPLPPDGYRERIRDYMRKATREAKLHTSWISPNTDYERATNELVDQALDRERGRAFMEELIAFLSRTLRPGLLNAVSQSLIKAAAPGIPDFYQGTELPEFLLVDPDNRKDVDYTRRLGVLRELEAAGTGDRAALLRTLLLNLADGRLKLEITRRALALRRRRAALFATGGYVPLTATGDRELHVIAFARTKGDETVLLAAARFFSTLPSPPLGAAAWGRGALLLEPNLGPAFKDALSGRTLRAEPTGGRLQLPLAEVFADLPQALLERV
jgi:(1->4)-alpha-D-glucan 1-alpha-D-glucosylmutase